METSALHVNITHPLTVLATCRTAQLCGFFLAGKGLLMSEASSGPPRVSRVWLVFALLALVVWLRQGEVLPRVFGLDADQAGVPSVQREDGLGKDLEIAEWLLSQPSGTTVSIPFEADLPYNLEARRQRFWLALLPEVAIQAGSPYVILPRYPEFEGELILNGDWFMLVRRQQDGAP